jgi:very-long-chain ceramide synthase
LLSNRDDLRPETLWVEWPYQQLDASTKTIYLFQLAVRLYQIFVVTVLEDKRQDFVTMLTHHIITVLLIYTSYVYRMTQIGIVILCTLDVADVLLPVRIS